MALIIVIITLVVVLSLEKTSNKTVNWILNWIPAILFAYVVPAIITHLFNLELGDSFLHIWSRNFIMPLAVVAVMSALSFRQLRIIGIRPILVFLSGSCAVSLLPFILLMLLGFVSESFHVEIIDNGYWQGLVTLVGSWIGGSTSQLVLKEVVECPENLFLTILVMDNVLVNMWTLLMFQLIKRSESFNTLFKINDPIKDFIPDEVHFSSQSFNSIAFTGLLCLFSVVVSLYLIKSFLLKILVLSVVGLIFGNFIRRWNHAFVIKGGGYLIITIMAILGLKLNFSNFSIPIEVVGFAVIWLVFHYVVMMITAYMFKLNFAWIPIGSMANVGGISTAPAVTKAYNEEWMPHAILLAILSMVTGTYWGLLTIYLFKTFVI